MSIDNKIVHLGFDNKQFESGVSESMSTLDKLNEKLKFKDADKSLSNLQSSVNGIDFSALMNGISSLEGKLSSVGIAGMTVVSRITNSIIDAAKQLEAATIGQIKSGGWRRATNIANAKFTIEGLKYNWEEVQKAADYAVTDTAYGLDEASKAASQLAASGVDFHKIIGKDGAGKDVTQMHKSLRAISGLAAMTNSSYEDIAHVFTRIAGQGRVMANDLNSIAARGINAAATLGEAMGKTEAEIRDMVSKGQIDFMTFSEAMDKAFGDHAKEANKTFSGALSNMKAALSRIGAIFAQPIIDKTNTFFIAVTSRIKEFQKALQDTTDVDGNKVVRFAGHFAEAWENGVALASKLVEKLNLSWFDTVASKMDMVAERANTTFKDIKWLLSDYADDVEETTTVTTQEAEVAKKVLKGYYGSKNDWAFNLKDFGPESTKRIIDYANALEKAGGKVKKVSIKIEDSENAVADSIANNVKQQKNQRKVKFHAVLNQLSVSFGILGRIAKNVVTSLSLVGKSIFTAFKNVFGFKDKLHGSTMSLNTFLLKIEEFSKKLIFSEDQIKAMTEKFTAFFKVVKKGVDFVVGISKKALTAVGNFIKTRKEISELPTAAQEALIKAGQGFRIFGKFQTIPKFLVKIFTGIRHAFDFLKTLTIPFLDDDTPIYEKIKVFGSSVWNALVTSFTAVNWKAGFEWLFGWIIDGFSKLNWKDATKIGIATWITTSFAKFLISLQSVGGMLASVSAIPGRISNLLYSLAYSTRKAGRAIARASIGYMVIKLAEAVLMIAGVLIIMSKLDQSSLYSAAAVMVIIMAVFAVLINFVDNLTTKSAMISGGSIGSAVNNIITSMRTIYAVALMIVALGAAVVLMSYGMAVLKAYEVDSSAILYIVTMLGTIYGFMYAVSFILKELSTTTGGALKLSALLMTVSVFILSLSAGVFVMSKALAGLKSIPEEDISNVISLFASIVVGVMIILALCIGLAGANPLGVLASAVVILAVFGTLSVLVLSISAAISTIALTLSQANLPIEQVAVMAAVFVGIIMAFLLVIIGSIALMTKILKDNFLLRGEVVVGGILAMSVMFVAIGAAMLLITVALKLIENVSWQGLVSMLAVIGAVIIAVYAFTQSASKLQPKQMLGAAVLFVGIGAMMVLLMMAINRISKLSFMTAGLLVAIGVLAVVTLVLIKMKNITSSATSNLSQTAQGLGGISHLVLYLVTGLLAFAVAMLFMAKALQMIGQVEKLGESLGVMVGIILTVSVALAALTLIAAKSFNSGDALFAVGAAFIMIAASMLIFAMAVSVLAGVSGNMLQVAIAFGVFLVVLVGLGALVAKFPQLGAGMTTVGKAMMYMGLGAALVGAGFLLVVTALKAILPYIPILQADTEFFLRMLEDHIGIMVVVTVIIVAIAAACTALGITVAPIIRGLVTVVSDGLSAILQILKRFAEGARNFVGGMTVRGRTVLVGLITTLCGALMHSTPQIVETIGTMILRLLGYLGSIIGDVVSALLELVINLINGLAEAIRSHSNRVAAAVFNLLYSLLDVVLAVLKELINIIFGQIFGGKVAEALGGFFDYAQEELDAHAAKMTADAEAADAAKESQIALRKAIGDTADAQKEFTAGGGGLEATATNAQKTELSLKSLRDEIGLDIAAGEGMKETYNDLPQAAQDAMIKAGVGTRSSTGAFSGFTTSGEKAGSLFGEGFDTGATNSLNKSNVMGTGSSDDIMAGLGVDKDMFGAAGDDASSEFVDGLNQPDTYSDAMDENLQDGVVKSYEVNEDEIKKAAEKHVNEASEKRIRAGRHRYEEAMTYCIAGIVKASKDGEEPVKKALEDLAKCGLKAFVGPNGLDENSPSKKTYSAGEYAVLGFTDAINGNADLAEKAMEGLADSGPDSGSILSRFFDIGKNVISGFVNGFSEKDPMYEKIGSMIQAAIGEIKAVHSKLNESIIDTYKINEKGISDATGKHVTNSAVLALRNGRPAYEDSMTYCIAGIVKAAKDGETDVREAMEHLAQIGVSAFTGPDGLDENSPSKKTYDAGMYAVLGFTEAVHKNGDKAGDAMETMAKSAGIGMATGFADALDTNGHVIDNAATGLSSRITASFGDPMKYVASMANGDIAYDPTIRPVLDTTAIATGAYGINSMFNNQNVTLSGLSGQLAADIGQLDSRNSDIIAELEALREEMSYLSEDMQNMQVVMDTGALVGTMAGPMDKAMGRRAIYRGRGN